MMSKTLDRPTIVALASSMLLLATPLAWGAGGGDIDLPPASNPAYYEQNILSRSGETVEPLGPNLMGETLNEYSGGLGFSHTDVSIPGNSALPVAVGRVLAVGTRQAVAGLFGDWDIDIPHLHTVAFTTSPDWYGGNGFGTFNQSRCSQFTIPPVDRYVASNRFVDLRPEGWWDGYHLYVPGSGDQTLLSRAGGPPTNPIQPTDGDVYPVVTKQHWQLACLSSLERGTGEGFLARSPDGTRYRFDHLVQRAYPGLDVRPYGTKPRIQIWILPTLVTDRFGNWVQYSYGGADGGQLTSITSSDGRAITLTYNGWGNRVGSVSDGTRTWTYAYDANGALQTVTQPDGSQWQFALSDLERDPFRTGGCANNLNYAWDYATHVGTITHPSGAVGTFALKR